MIKKIKLVLRWVAGLYLIVQGAVYLGEPCTGQIVGGIFVASGILALLLTELRD